MKGSEIFLGDLVRVARSLSLTGSDLEQAASLFGLEILPVKTVDESKKPEMSDTESTKKEFKQPEASPTTGEPEKNEKPPQPNGPVSTPRKPEKTAKELQPTRIETLDSEPPVWFEATEPFVAELASELSFSIPLEPLFSEMQSRSLLSTALATRRFEGQLDYERIITARANRIPLKSLPCQPIPSLRVGVQVILDRREAMMPFFVDQRHLVGQLRKVVGRDRVEVLQFLHHPQTVFFVRQRSTEPYKFPAAGTPILLVSDLGIGIPPLSVNHSSELEWLCFVASARHARCPVVALVPYPSARWPSKLAESMIILQWDRSMTVGAVRRRIGPGLSVPR